MRKGLNRLAAFLAATILPISMLTGCATYGVIMNEPLAVEQATPEDVLQPRTVDADQSSTNDITMILAFSGGGTRAAALSYGVLKGLRDTQMHSQRMLDEVDAITSVSGGSFTAAYYALHGEETFQSFEPKFLRRDIESEIKKRWLRPGQIFSRSSRTVAAMDLYSQDLFANATFADVKRAGGPALIINASDLGSGVRFSYIPEYFLLLCSRLDDVPLAQAVTASSAVPFLFDPVMLANYSTCSTSDTSWLSAMQKRAAGNPNLTQLANGLQGYSRKDKRPFIHLVDGGITDNLGLRALYDIVEASGGAKAYIERLGKPVSKRFVVIVVDAASTSDPVMDLSPNPPSLKQTAAAISDAQINRYSVDTLQLISNNAKQWAREWSTLSRKVELYMVHLDFGSLKDRKLADTLSHMPTTLQLENWQVDQLIDAGQMLLRENPEFQRLLNDIESND